MSIRIISVGKKHEPWVSEGIERYQKRLKRPFEIEWVLLPHSTLPNDRAAVEESQRILNRLNASDYVVLLDERGKNIDSPALAKLMLGALESSKDVVFVIGGAFGVDNNVQDRANFIWSLSGLVFPHQLVRLILTEQVYRSQEISAGNPYHHE
jgi:23S rRNA (pseudouridine1915-N3)-methyltransferase